MKPIPLAKAIEEDEVGGLIVSERVVSMLYYSS